MTNHPYVIKLFLCKGLIMCLWLNCWVGKMILAGFVSWTHIPCVVSHAPPWLLTQDMNDYLNCVKLSPYTIIVLERSELCHWVSGLPGFVHYPKNTLIPLTSSVKHSRSSSKKLRTKENHVSTTAVKEQQHGGKSELSASAAAHNSGTVQSFPNHLVSGGESQTLSSH